MARIIYLPWGDERQASSRLRVYKPGAHLSDSFIGNPGETEYRKGDVLIIQKRPYFEELTKAKEQGAKVIYDIDDRYDTPEFRQMIDNADLVTVDTEEKKKWIPKAVVIPDCLDWDGEYRTEQPQNDIIGWTGYGNGTVYLAQIKDKIPKRFTLRLITSPDWPKYIEDKEARIQTRPWSLDMVDQYLRECEFTIYPLDESEFATCKGMHKLLKSWANKIPCYTSPMPDYVKAMEEAGVGDRYIVTDWSKLENGGFDEQCYRYAMRYTSDRIAELWANTIKSL